MYSRANKVPIKINKLILEYHKKQLYWNTVKNGTYVKQSDKFSKCAKFEGFNFKNDSVNAKNAEITNSAIMRIFNEVA